MKRKTIIIFLLIIICALCKNSFAMQTGTLSLETNYKTVKVGEEFEVTLNLQNSKTAAYNFYLDFDTTKVEVINNTENSNIINNQIICVWFDNSGGSGEKEGVLQTFKFRAKEEGIASFKIQGEFWNKETELIETNEVELQLPIEINNIEIEEEKVNTKLEILAIEDALLNPPFDINEIKYKTEISNNIQNIKILAIPEDENATVQIIGKDNLHEGENTVTIIVTGADKITQKSYQVIVYKRDKEEEKTYEKKIKDNQEKLGNIYKVEKLSTENLETQNIEKTTKKNNNKIILAILISAIIGILVYIIFKGIRIKKNK